MTAREVLLAWAKSPGFAAIHNGQATDEQIVDDLTRWLSARGFGVVDVAALNENIKESRAFIQRWEIRNQGR